MKLNKNHRAIIDHIASLLGIDVELQATPLRRRAINVDIAEVGRSADAAIRQIARAYQKIRVEENGGRGIAIFLL